MSDGAVKKRSGWFYVGIGCGTLMLLGIALVGVGVYWARSWGKQLEARMKDPATKEREVKRILGTDKLPDGYYALFTLPPVPMMQMDSVVLTGQKPGPDGKTAGYGGKGFIYFNGPDSLVEKQAFDAYASGKSKEMRSPFMQNFMKNIRSGERLRQGQVALAAGGAVRYVAHRADLARMRGPAEGITNVLWVECPGSPRTREGLWFTRDPEPESPPDKADFKGSAADEDALTAFLSAFDLCGAKKGSVATSPTP